MTRRKVGRPRKRGVKKGTAGALVGGMRRRTGFQAGGARFGGSKSTFVSVARRGFKSPTVNGQGLEVKDYEMTPVSSSWVNEVGYDSRNKRLMISTDSGRAGYWEGVPFKVFEELFYAMSKGTFLNRYVKGKFDWSRM